MSSSRALALLRLASSVALFAAPALADVYVVDDDGGPGVDFTDLPPAIAAAQPGDVLLVQDGSYSGFTLNEGVSIVGQGDAVKVLGAATVSLLPSGQTASLVRLDLARLSLLGDAGLVLLDDVSVLGNSTDGAALTVNGCTDVRGIGVTSWFSGAGPQVFVPTGHALTLDNARLELNASSLQGRWGFYGGDLGDGGAGGHGARLGNNGWLHLVLSEVAGGPGGDGSQLCFPVGTNGGTGGDALQLNITSKAFAMGTPSVSEILAGSGGGYCFPGASGKSLRLAPGCFARQSGQTVVGQVEVDPTATLESPAELDPYLERFGTPIAGTQVRFNVFGAAGDDVTLYLARQAALQPIPGVLIEKLTSEDRSFSLGTIAPGGFATFVFKLSPLLQPGTRVFAQAKILRNGVELRTNSVPVIVR